MDVDSNFHSDRRVALEKEKTRAARREVLTGGHFLKT
jgi:hypothetical protein